MFDVLEKLTRYLPYGQDVIDQPCGNRAFDHGIELRRLGILDDHETACPPDFPDPKRPVRAAAGKKHGYRFLVLVLGERAEEKVDRQPQAVALYRLGQT